jgi:hypothetical protein
MSNADYLREANPWAPMRKPLDLAHLGKLAEELSEAASACARCIIQGIDEREPATGKQNREWLEDEIADVLAGFDLVSERFHLNQQRIRDRLLRKKAHLRQWHDKIGGPL